MSKIKFGTDGWRAIIADEFTVNNVCRVAQGTAKWLKSNFEYPSVVIGNDCRFGGKLFSETAAKVLASEGIKVFIAENNFVSTPMVSLGTVIYKASAGIVITASHNPADYNGFKIKAQYGGPATPSMIDELEKLIPDSYEKELKELDNYRKDGLIHDCDLETLYVKHVEKHFDMEVIRNSKMNWAYDAMYGAGQNVMRRILPDITFLHCEYNPSFDGQAPEPIHRNLTELATLIELAENIDSALVTDGDADRIGMYNHEGKFIDSHHILLLLIHYLYKIKGLRGAVYSTFSCTSKIQKLCDFYNLENKVTKIGFKYICDLMVNANQPFLVGGEESGGIAITGTIPERDGIWIGLVIWEFMAKTNKSLNELIAEIYDIVGEFAVERYDLHIEPILKDKVIERCKLGSYNCFGNYTITQMEDIDGYKFHLSDGAWVMIRPSGTEPVLRVYAEAATSEDAFSILEAVKSCIINDDAMLCDQ